MTNEELVLLIQAGEEPSRNLGRLYQQNIKIITRFVYSFSVSVELDDLLQEAYFGLLKAVEGFNPDLGYKFITYAEWHITQAARRYAQKHSGAVRLPVGVQEEIRTYKKADENFLKTHNRQATSTELAAILGTSAERIEQLRQLATREVRADEEVLDGKQTRLDTIEDESAEAELNTVDRDIDERLVFGVVKELPERSRNIIFLRFWDEMTYDDIAVQLNIPRRSQVVSYEHSILRMLRSNKILRALADSYGYTVKRYIPRNPYKGTLANWRTGRGSSVELTAEGALFKV